MAALFIMRWLLHHYPTMVWAFSAIVSLSPQVLPPPAAFFDAKALKDRTEKLSTTPGMAAVRDHHRGLLLHHAPPLRPGPLVHHLPNHGVAPLRGQPTLPHLLPQHPPPSTCHSASLSAPASPPPRSPAMTRCVASSPLLPYHERELAQVSVGSASIGRLLDVTIRLRNKHTSKGTVRGRSHPHAHLEKVIWSVDQSRDGDGATGGRGGERDAEVESWSRGVAE